MFIKINTKIIYEYWANNIFLINFIEIFNQSVTILEEKYQRIINHSIKFVLYFVNKMSSWFYGLRIKLCVIVNC